MASSFVIGLDSSTTGCKAIAWDKSGQALAEGRVTYPILRPQPDWAEQDAEQWWSGACAALADLSNKIDLSCTEALSISAQRESFVLLDRQRNPLRNAILWLDERSRSQVDDLVKQFGAAALHRLTGKPPSMSLALPKILWLAAHEPEVCRQAAWLLDTHAFLVHRLTGRFATSLACADPMGFVDMASRSWAGDLIAGLGLRLDQFPELVPSGVIVGRVTPSAAHETGLPEGLPVVAGSGDGQSAGLGTNTLGGESAYLNLGTAVIGGFFSPSYLVDPTFRTHFAPLPTGCFLETVIRGGASTISWFVDQFGGDLASEEHLEIAASAIPPGSQGLMVVPYWNSVMNPYWDPLATGITIGWTAAHGRPHFYRAIVEGIACEQRLAGEGVMAALGRRFTGYVAVGGGSRSRLWCQVLADVTGLPIHRARTVEASSLGAGILAATAAGWYPTAIGAAAAMTGLAEGFTPDPQTSPFYDRLYREVYMPLFPSIRPLIGRLSDLVKRD